MTWNFTERIFGNNKKSLEKMNAGITYLQQQEQTEFVKVFLYHFQFINWIAWGQAKV